MRFNRLAFSSLFQISRVAFLLAVVLGGDGCASEQGTSTTRPLPHKSMESVIERAELANLLRESSPERFILLDVRDAAEYESGHVAGAARVDPTEWKKESLSGETGLDHDAFWHDRIGSVGVNGREPVIIYDDGRMTEAARLWFILQHFGVAQVTVVNGGYRALEPLIASDKISVSREKTLPRVVKFQPCPENDGTITLVERKRVLKEIEQKQAQIFDARSPAEFKGQDLRGNARGGHLPTAINLPHTELLDEHGHLRTSQHLAELFREAGFQRGQTIITHCDSGGRASLAALAARNAGYGPVMNYYLSFGDWSTDSSCPVEGPASQPATLPLRAP